MKTSPLFLFLFVYAFTCVSSAQTLEYIGEIPDDLKGANVTLFLEGNCDKRLLPATFLAFKAAGHRVFVDGERRPTFGGLVTTVSVSDTTFTRRAKNAVVRNIHENELTDLIVVIDGSFSNIAIRSIFIHIIERQTGELLQTISCRQRNVSLGFDRYTDELLAILNSEARRVSPLQIAPGIRR